MISLFGYLIVGAIGVLSYVWFFTGSRASRGWRWAAVCLFLAAAGFSYATPGPRGPELLSKAQVERPLQIRDRHAVRSAADNQPHFVGSDACRSCHPGEHHSWQQSYHRSMTQVPTPESVVSQFDGRTLQHGPTTAQLHRNGREFWVTVREGAGKPAERRKVVLMTGSHHLQMYWTTTDKQRVLDKFPFVYMIAEQQWVPVDSTFLHPPDQVSSRQTGKWNTSCMYCHSTGANPGFAAEQAEQLSWDHVTSLSTEAAEFGISCEACHGPGSLHCETFRNPLHRYREYFKRPEGESSEPAAAELHIVQPEKLDPVRANHVCAQCHSVHSPRSDDHFRSALMQGFKFRPGMDFETGAESDRAFVLPTQPNLVTAQTIAGDPGYFSSLFWQDGGVRVTGREFNSLAISPCYTHGDAQRGMITCLSCHQMHPELDPAESSSGQRPAWANDQLRAGHEDNQSCVQCHTQFRDTAAIAAHTHHPVTSSGSLCYNCHMPHTTFGLLTAIRTHAIESPRVQTTLASGRPNGCNLCHLDQSIQWTAQRLHEWYGHEVPTAMAPVHETTSAGVVWGVSGDAGQRVIAAWALSWDPTLTTSERDWRGPFLLNLMADPYDAVRAVAFKSFKKLYPELATKYGYMDAPANRTQEITQLAQQLRQTARQLSPERGERVLILPNGDLDSKRFQRLLQDRDHRPVLLNE